MGVDGYDKPHCQSCGLVHRLADALEPGVLIDGRYAIVRRLGSGAHGWVFEAHDVHLERRVALKFQATEAGVEVDQFMHEARALATLRSPHIPVVHAFGVHGRMPFFVMERIEGEPLSETIRLHRSHGQVVPLHRALHILEVTASALSAAHGAGILHRDLKPENILLEHKTGRPVLVDFGIAVREIDARPSHRVVGTPAFMAPEIFRGDPPSPASDVYALGCVAFELLTGEPPFRARTTLALLDQHMTAAPPQLSERRPELRPYDAVVMRAVAKAPQDRFSTSAAFAAALRSATGHEMSEAVEIERDRSGSDDAIRVLIVDDDPHFARAAKQAVRIALQGAQVALAHTKHANAALRVTEQWPPDLLLLDQHLPGMTGAELLSQIRSRPGGDEIAVVVVSGAMEASERWPFSSLGVEHFLAKPERPDVFREAVAAVGRTRGWLAGPPTRYTVPPRGPASSDR